MSRESEMQGNGKNGAVPSSGTASGNGGIELPRHLTQARPPFRRKLALMSLGLFFLLAGAGWGAYWYMVLRHHQVTDDAYAGGNVVQITPQVAGSVVEIAVDDTDMVQAGDVLVRLDPTDARLGLDKACSALADTVREVKRLMSETRRLEAGVSLRRVELGRAQGDLVRREKLGRLDAVAIEELQHARETVDVAAAALRVAEEQLRANRVLLLDGPVAKQPPVERAAAQVREAWLALHRTVVVSPVSGQVARRTVQLGGRVAPGTPLMAVVPLGNLWVDANFKEGQLRQMRIGQRARVTSDLYGNKVEYAGRVVGFSAGTGSSFALLPPQNASGNWIKVVQRVPVRIELDRALLAEHPLRIGLSMTVTVDTGDQNGKVLAASSDEAPAYATDALSVDMTEAEALVGGIITANAS